MTSIPKIDGLSLHERIGRGGYASVWRATDDAFGRTVAVKVLDDDPVTTTAPRN